MLDIKGENTEQNRAKCAALGVWITAVNAEGGIGAWVADVASEPARVYDLIDRHAV